MRRYFLTVLLVGTCLFTAHAQFLGKGSIIGNGSFNLFSGKYSGSSLKTSSFTLSPSAAYLVIDNLAVGGVLNLSTDASKSSNNKTSDLGLSLGPWVRYYLDQGVFGEFSADFGSSNTKKTSGSVTVTSKSSSTDIFAGLGYSVKLSDAVFFDPVLGYSSTTYKDKTTKAKSTLGGALLKAGFTVKLK